jgi:hypothetical protein
MNRIIDYHIFYPGTLALPFHNWYSFKLNNLLIAFKVTAHVKPLHAIDFSKTVSETVAISFDSSRPAQTTIDFTTVTQDERRVTDSGKYVFDQEVPSVGFSRFYSELHVCHEEVSIDNSADPKISPTAILEKVIKCYRIASGDHRIPLPNECRADTPIVRRAVRELSPQQDSLALLERLKLTPEILKLERSELQIFDRFESSPNTTGVPSNGLDSLMCALLSDVVTPSSREYFDWLSQAMRAFHTENYKYAFLETFMLLEVVTSDFLRYKKIAAGVSKTKLNDYSKDLRISYMINVEVPIFISPMTDAKREILGKVDAIRNKRNNVIHQGYTVNENDARSAIETVQYFVCLLDEHEPVERRRSGLPEIARSPIIVE